MSCFMHRMTWTYDGRTETGTCAGCGRTTVRHWTRRHHGGHWEGPRSPHEPPWSLLAGEWTLTNPGWWPAMKRTWRPLIVLDPSLPRDVIEVRGSTTVRIRVVGEPVAPWPPPWSDGWTRVRYKDCL